MTQEAKETYDLVGSLSNDLFRIANLVSRGSSDGARRFLVEAKRWAKPLKEHHIPDYIASITNDICDRDDQDISQESAETYLMFGVLLQNYALRMTSSS
jgi:hypothetical protein